MDSAAEGTTSPPKQNDQHPIPEHDSLGTVIEKLARQLQSGCDHASCSTTTCFTFRSKTSDQPLRQYSDRSVRAMAIVLADHKDGAESFLCPHIDHRALEKPLHAAVDSRVDPRSLTQRLVDTDALKNLNRVLEGETGKSAVHRKAIGTINTLYHDLSHLDFVQHCLGCIELVCAPLPGLYQDNFSAETFPSGNEAEIDPYRYRLVVSIIQAMSKRMMMIQPGLGKPHSAVKVAKHLINEHHRRGSALLPCWISLLKTVVVKEWSGRHILSISDLACQALQLMQFIWAVSPTPDTIPVHQKDQYRWLKSLFHCDRILHHLVTEDVCFSWLSYKQSAQHCHILSYNFLFSESAQFEYFRTCCHQKMRKSVMAAALAARARDNATQLLGAVGVDPGHAYLDRRMQVSLETYLVLEISRGTLVPDALDQLWQRETRELHRPLRIRLGSDLGEVGADLGGIQLEFFSLVFNQICDAQSSLFETDPATQLSWFRTGSLEPLYRFELFGLLFGLAVYNGITLPVSFPLVFYAKLLGRHADQEHMREGWPDLHSNFVFLLNYQGDVDDLALDYAVGLKANGITLSVDMKSYAWYKLPNDPKGEREAAMAVHYIQQDKTGPVSAASSTESSDEELDPSTLKWPGWAFHRASASSHPPPVTRENLRDYVNTYIAWTSNHSVRPQFTAFAAGFYRVVDPRAIQLLSPQNFRQLVEGSREIVTTALKRFATYEGGYTEDSPQIQWFWSIVEAFSQSELRLLLAFVTACERLPANHAAVFRFVISDSGLMGEELPRSSTCFSTLHLPRYKTKEKMEEKLTRALEHSLGFGQA